MIISGFAAYVKQLWKNKPDTSTPLSAARLTHMEDGIEGNSDAIEKLAAAVVSQIANDPDKIASMAALYAVQQAAFPKTNLVSQIVNDETKAASAAALYSVNETLKQTNSNLDYKNSNLPVLNLPRGRWFVTDTILGITTGWYVEVISWVLNDSTKIVIAYPADANLHFFYVAKMMSGQWLGWEKYEEVSQKFKSDHNLTLQCDGNGGFIYLDNYDPTTDTIVRLQFDHLGGIQIAKIQRGVILNVKTISAGW